jgi:hypothetical protein
LLRQDRAKPIVDDLELKLAWNTCGFLGGRPTGRVNRGPIRV